jgi:Cu+-exporting ATPase
VSTPLLSRPGSGGTEDAGVLLELEGLHCASCARRVATALEAVSGVAKVAVDPLANRARVETAGEGPRARDLVRAVEEAGYGVRVVDHELALPHGLDEAERGRLGSFLSSLPGVVGVESDADPSRLRIRVLAGGPSGGELRGALARLGSGSDVKTEDVPGERTKSVRDESVPPGDEGKESASLVVALVLAAATLALAMLLPPLLPVLGPRLRVLALLWRGPLEAVLATLAVFGPGRGIVRSGLGAWRRLAPDMDALVTTGILAAWGYGLAVLFAPGLFPPAARHFYFETAAVLVAVLLGGRFLERRVRHRADDALGALARLVAPEAVRTIDGREVRVTVEDLAVGDLVRVKPGERIPVDGLVRDGEASVDESLLTGEPLPRRRGPGARVSAGTLVLDTPLTVEATAVGSSTRLAAIVRTVEAARASRLPVQKVAERVVRVFAPTLLGAAALAALGWLLVGGASALPDALTAFVTVLVVACPCAVGLAAPAAVSVASSRAAALGVLVRRAETFEILARTDTIAFDKTGTLTLGRPILVSATASSPWTEESVLAMAAALERGAGSHPLARAVLEAARERGLVPCEAEAVVVRPGRGVSGRVEGRSVELEPEDEAEGDGEASTRVRLLVDGRPAGVLLFRDRLRPESREVLDALCALGLRPVLLSGDGKAATEAVAESLGIGERRARSSPEDKADWVLAERARGHRVVFVGDGLNDAPALAAADVGVAPAEASDAAGSSADVLLLRPGLDALPDTLRLARRTLATVRANLFWALVYNVALIPLAAGAGAPWGIRLSPVEAALAMTLSSLFVLGNSLRLLGVGERLRGSGKTAGAGA